MKSKQAQVAAIIRTELKTRCIVARVTSTQASMMTAVDVRITNPTPDMLKDIRLFCARYCYGSFDGMTDSYDYSNTKEDVPQVKFLTVEGSYTDEIRQAAWTLICNNFGDENTPKQWKDAALYRLKEEYTDHWVWRVLNGELFPAFWDAHQPPKEATVSEYLDAIDRLERVFNVDRHACVGDREKNTWRGICERALTGLKGLDCARAKPRDLERERTIVAKVEAFLTEPKPTDPDDNDDDKEAPPSAFVTPDYENRQEDRKDRLLDRAERAEAESDSTYAQAKDMASVIPFGQPILVGHHSEQRDRNYRGRIHNKFGKAFALQDKAKHYQQRAASVGHSGIASNDPEAIDKLKLKLENLVKSQEIMKAVNRIVRGTGLSDDEKISRIVSENLLSESNAAKIMEPGDTVRKGFASYSLTNNNAEIRRTKRRIQELQSLRDSTPIAFKNDDFSINVDDGYIVIDFAGGKPSEATRTLVKSAAFKWSRYRTAWVRKATANAAVSAECLLDNLKKIDAIY